MNEKEERRENEKYKRKLGKIDMQERKIGRKEGQTMEQI